MMSVDGFVSTISPDWFQTYLDSGDLQHVNSSTILIDGVSASDDDIVTIDGTQGSYFDWIVQFDTKALDGMSADETNTLLNGGAAQFEVICGLGLTGQVLVRSSGASEEEVSKWLDANDYVAAFEMDVMREFQLASEDPYAWALWGLDNYGQTGGTADADIDATEAWDTSTGSSEIVVAVIDTGVDYTHPDLAANIWTNPGEIAGNGIDDDGNGFIDDIHGFDFVNNDGDPMDDQGHGTHVSGTIGAANNGQGVVGVNWNTSIMGLKFLSSSGSGYTSDAVRAVNYATMMRTMYDVNVRVTNNSWGGGGYSTALDLAIQASGDAGILFVAAAGNSGTNNDVSPHYPSSYTADNIISVAATDDDDQLAYFSCYGATSVDLAAPGVSIYSTRVGGGYTTMSGTSMATPHVAGVAALAWSVNPDATVAEIRDAILNGVDTLGGLTGMMTTGGRLNAANTLGLLSPTDPTLPTIGSFSASPGTVVTTDGAIVTLTASNVQDADGTIAAVLFYEDTNANGQHDVDDLLIATVANPASANVTTTVDTTGFAAGHHRYFVEAVDNDGQSSRMLNTTFEVVAPDDHGNDAQHATAVSIGDVVDGMMDAGDIDWFAFDAVAGSFYRFETTLSTLGDSVLYLYDQDGVTLLDYNDDFDYWTGYESRIFWEAETSGTYFLAVEAYSPSDVGEYQLELVEVVDDHGDFAAVATDVAMNSTIAGVIDYELDRDWFAFEAVAGNTYRFDTTLIDLPDSWITLYDQNGYTILGYDDDSGQQDWASSLTWTASGTGEYFIVVEAYAFYETGSYTLDVICEYSPPTLDAIADQTMSRFDDDLTIALAAADLDGDTLTYSAVAFSVDPTAQEAYDLDQELGLRMHPSGYFTNYRGQGEKYLYSDSGAWYYILSDGGLYAWGGSFAASEQIATLDPSYYTDPSLLHDAQAPAMIPFDQATVSIADGLLTVDPDAGYVGQFDVRVGVSDGVTTTYRTFSVSIANQAPTLDPIADQAMSRFDDDLTIALAAADLDGDALTFSVEAFSVDPTAQEAYDLDRDLGLRMHPSGYFTNFRGQGEKYLYSDSGAWYYILSDGGLYAWGGSFAASEQIATLDSSYYVDPSLLHNAQSPEMVPFDQATVSIADGVLTIDPDAGYLGEFEVRVGVSDGVSTVYQTFSVTVANQAPTLDPIADQTMSYHDDSTTIALSAADLDGDALTFSVEAFAVDPTAQEAYDLDQELGLRMHPTGYFTNFRGQGEKYLYSDSGAWYYILADGGLYAWGGSFAASEHLATLDSSYYVDPSLLHNAQAPTATPAEGVNVSIADGVLTIDPDAGYLGEFEVRVGVSDGATTTYQTFAVSVENQAPTLDPIADQTMSTNDDSTTIALAAADLDGDALTFSVETFAIDPTAQEAYDLDQELGLRMHPSGYFTNYRGQGEKYLYSDSGAWYYILSDGGLYAWGGSFAASEHLATLDSSYYVDPSLLHNAQAPTATPVEGVNVSIADGVLTIDPDAGYLGEFEVRVGVSDGVTTTYQTFAVSVVDDSPEAMSVPQTYKSATKDKLTAAIDAALDDLDDLLEIAMKGLPSGEAVK